MEGSEARNMNRLSERHLLEERDSFLTAASTERPRDGRYNAPLADEDWRLSNQLNGGPRIAPHVA
jgi:hypothetical protein